MEVKKTQAADMTNRSTMYFLIGLNVVLLITFLALEFSRSYAEKIVVEEIVVPPIEDEDVIITERQFDEPPPPIEAPAPPEIPVEVETVDDEVELEDPVEIQNQTQTQIPPKNTQTQTEPKVQKGPPDTIKPEKKDLPKFDEDKPVTRLTAKRGPIYPGCEEYKDQGRKLYACFNKRFNQDLENYLDAFELDPGEKPRVVNLKFQIDKNGNLKLVDASSSGEASFKKNAESAFGRLSARMERRNKNDKGIEPAINTNDQPAVMDYNIAVKFKPQE